MKTWLRILGIVCAISVLGVLSDLHHDLQEMIRVLRDMNH